MIAVLDYGMGNLRSVEKALEHVGAEAVVTRELPDASGIVLPGVGAFPKAMERLGERAALVRERAEAGVPVLGICLGMQLLFESSTELGGARGIGLLPGRVDRLSVNGLKLPQIGWNAVSWKHRSPLADGLPEPCPMYHVHTYAVQSDAALATATYGEEFVTAVEHGRVYGVQFHPEKSGRHGLQLLRNFVSICGS
ncbi:MAG TPA: imidazole glycerol phosphate synthase subunit HisH [Thermoleophilaceae bacterium]|nr:imidazole glycerol phosphate synthase subunit HisH [Thermoleophilaceae bacterium]